MRKWWSRFRRHLSGEDSVTIVIVRRQDDTTEDPEQGSPWLRHPWPSRPDVGRPGDPPRRDRYDEDH